MEVPSAVAIHPPGAQEREHPARQQDCGDQRRAPRSAGEATAGRRPAHQGEARDQSVAIWTLRTIPLRWGPRKPGHWATVFAAVGGDGRLHRKERATQPETQATRMIA
jgi:hypothetical protein